MSRNTYLLLLILSVAAAAVFLLLMLTAVPETVTPPFFIKTGLLLSGVLFFSASTLLCVRGIWRNLGHGTKAGSAQLDLEELTVNDPGLEAFYNIFVSLRDGIETLSSGEESLLASLQRHFDRARRENIADAPAVTAVSGAESRETDSRIDVMREMVRSLLQCSGRTAVLEGILRMGAALSRSGRASLMLVSEEGSGLRFFQTAGWEPDSELAARTIPMNEGVAGKVVQEGKRMLVTDVVADLGNSSRDSYKSKSFIILPVHEGERIIGVLNLTDKEGGDIYGLEELELLNFLIDIGALALAYKE